MNPRLFTISLNTTPAIQLYNAGYLDDADRHIHINRPILYWHQIFLVEQGTLHLDVDGECLSANAGTVIFNPAGTRQRGFATSSGRTRYAWMHFDADVEEVFAAKAVQAGMHAGDAVRNGKKLSTAFIPLIFQPHHASDLLRIGHMLAQFQPLPQTERSALLTALLCRMMALHLDTSGNNPPPGTRRASEIALHIHTLATTDTLAPSLSAKHVADHFGVQVSNLNRFFKRHTGTTVGNRIVQERIDRARFLLSTGSSIKETARCCGYTSSTFFARQFKGETGVSPSVYREEERF